jgi:hypothetical protein
VFSTPHHTVASIIIQGMKLAGHTVEHWTKFHSTTVKLYSGVSTRPLIAERCPILSKAEPISRPLKNPKTANPMATVPKSQVPGSKRGRVPGPSSKKGP